MHIQAYYKNFAAWITNQTTWEGFGESVLRIALIIIIGQVVIWITSKTIDRVVINQTSNRLVLQTRRMTTVGKLVKNIISYAGYFIIGMLVLSEFGVQLAPLLAGAGVIGLAIGFGAQSLVKDIITGFFIIFEDQFAVGDVIQTGTFKGTVEVIGLRATRIHSWTGEVHIIPNGMINEVTNFSMHNSVAFIDVSIGYEEDAERAITLIRKELEKFEDDNLVNRPEVLGIQTIASTELKVRVTAECLPNTNAIVARSLNAYIKKVMDGHGIDIPYPRMVTYHRNERSGDPNGA
ncbi:mechanosensitive ion channel family protein [Paenibacillus glycanilyticus]|uniref:mechanosensitive ion channel family protein n=1 Tax=Paenibacillus glycanilyticus TaxID=126569 RepID=UPI00203AB3E0|nr:mechanosensitive ion channel family protein [Paenibacillus glycanilyticus]MCM3627634.1 mechanosensitive ion channel family protein [Paenibacillus glycanilyticus]